MTNKQFKQLENTLIELYARVSEMTATNKALEKENAFLKELLLKK